MVRVIALALAGAATTVGVAWAVALRGIVYRNQREPSQEPTATLQPGTNDALVLYPPTQSTGWTMLQTFRGQVAHVSDGRAKLQWLDGGLSMDAPTYKLVDYVPDDRHPPEKHANSCFELHFGWPCRSHWAAQDIMVSGCSANFLGWRRAIVFKATPLSTLTLFFRDDRLNLASRSFGVPVGILPGGFALNAGVYAGGWWFALIGSRWATQWWRSRRGLCPSCGYPRTGLALAAYCPECGQPPRPSANRFSPGA